MTIVTSKELVFMRGDFREIIPAGTPCHVFNKQLDKTLQAEGEELIQRCQEINRRSERPTHLVMVIQGRCRLVERGITVTVGEFEIAQAQAQAQAAAASRPPAIAGAKPVPTTEPESPKKLRQTTMF